MTDPWTATAARLSVGIVSDPVPRAGSRGVVAFHAKYTPVVDQQWGGPDMADNRRVFSLTPRVVSAFGL